MEVSLENVGEQYGANLGNSTSSVVSLGLHHIATPGSKNEVHPQHLFFDHGHMAGHREK